MTWIPAPSSAGPPEYVIILAASQWVKTATRKTDSTSGTPCTPAKTPSPPPTSNPTWKPNHDRTRSKTMTLTITGTTISSDQSPHTARHTPGRNGWEVSWLPGRTLDRNTAITAMVLADVTGPGDMHPGHRLWIHVEGWAAELRLTAPEAIARTSQPPSGISRHREASSLRPDHEAAD